LSKKIIAVTGASGFLGKKIVKLLKKNYRIIIFSTQKSKNTKKVIYKRYSLNENYEYIFKSNKIEGIIHIATNYGRDNKNREKVYLANYKIPSKIFKAFIKSNIKFFINTDTFYSIKDNVHLKNYILSKKKFFLKIYKNKNKNKKIINLKLFHLVGRNDNKQKFIPSIIRALKTNKLIQLNFPKNYIDFIHVDDVVNAYIKIVKNINLFKKINYNIDICTGKTYSILKLVKDLKISLDSKSKIICSRQLNKKKFFSKKENLIKKLWKPEYSFKKIIKELSY
jgi:CDP-paratose synthetase